MFIFGYIVNNREPQLYKMGVFWGFICILSNIYIVLIYQAELLGTFGFFQEAAITSRTAAHSIAINSFQIKGMLLSGQTLSNIISGLIRYHDFNLSCSITVLPEPPVMNISTSPHITSNTQNAFVV